MNLRKISPSSVAKQFSSALRKIDLTALKKHRDMLELVKSTAYETEQVMGYLKYKKEEWVVLRENEHPWHKIATEGLNTLLRHYTSGKLTFLFHLESRWLLVMEGEGLIPAIFLFTELPRDGVAVSYYRIFGGTAISWIPDIIVLVNEILKDNPPTPPVIEKKTPFESLYKVNFGGVS